MRMLPPVSVPIVAAASRAAIAAPEPPLEPPGMRVGFHGLRVGPKCGLFVVTPNANSCVLSLPSRTAPASREPPRDGASVVGHAVGVDLRAARSCGCRRCRTRSLRPIGMPWSGPRIAPRAISSVARRASASARSAVTVT